MYCEKCGMYISDSDKGCINCSNKNNNKNNKNDIIKWVIIIVSIIVLINVVWFGISYFYLKNSYEENLERSLTRVPYAVQDIEAGSMIYANMVSSKNYMRKDMPDGDYYLATEDIVGKCVDYDVVIKKNSLFYEDMLVDCDELPDGFYSGDE